MSGDPVDELGVTATTLGGGSVAGVAGQLGKYVLERELGAGGMGVVYAAYDPELDRRVALKVLRVVRDDARARLLREARAMAKLGNPNVVVVHDAGTVGDRDYVAMELIDGGTLADWLGTGQHSLAERIDAFLAAGRGLAAAHAAGIVHRDFKPQNILRGRDGRIVVTDFGLARSIDGATDESTGSATAAASPLATLTNTGALLGTPAYMALEQWTGGTIGPATDQFAFCVALWEAIAGARPFAGTTLEEIHAAVERGPTALDKSDLPRWLRSILLRGLDPDPAARWPNMNSLLAAIDRARRTRWKLFGALAMVASIIIAVVALSGRSSRPTGEPAVDPRVMQFTKIAGGHVTAPQAAVDGLISALATKTGARFVPQFANGVPIGFKLYNIHAGSFLDAIGLLNGDVLIAIDGHPVDTEPHLAASLRALAPRPRLELQLRRTGTMVTLTIEATN